MNARVLGWVFAVLCLACGIAFIAAGGWVHSEAAASASSDRFVLLNSSFQGFTVVPAIYVVQDQVDGQCYALSELGGTMASVPCGRVVP